MTKTDAKIQPLNLLTSTHKELKAVSTRLIRPESGAKAGMSAVADAAIQYFLKEHAPFIRKGRSIEQVMKMASTARKQHLPKNTVLIQYGDEFLSLGEVARREGHDRKWVKRRVIDGVFQGE